MNTVACKPQDMFGADHGAEDAVTTAIWTYCCMKFHKKKTLIKNSLLHPANYSGYLI